MKLYDYIYVDLEKVVSLYSQLTGGVVEVRETHNESGLTSDNKRNYDFKVFKHSAGGTSHDKEINKETPEYQQVEDQIKELESGRGERNTAAKNKQAAIQGYWFIQY